MSIGGLEINRSLPLDLWLNNIPALIERLDKNEGLSSQDWIILALSPLAGRDVWQSLLQKQAQKLSVKGEHHAAVMCLIACGEIYEAINVYKQADMYREALTLAKIRLPQDDPIIFDLHSDWALQLEKEPSYEQAAMCYIASQKPAAIPNALNAVARAGDVSGLCMSASLALLLGDSSAEERLTRYKQEQEVSGKTRSL
ncbi:11252_t:CDS:2 [Paraglomus occultum]|uniref:11252_t:CDS:1 n=1 Tax=Paraglomus occultum TaxID=144539 RepID=A0A9N8W5K9_9GLOM|nr:11252_t:CDS:2 [Paraglomus occultum]